MTANEITEALRNKHWKDVFVPQCKTGPTHYSAVGIMDAWVMRKSWVNFETIGYEIKVSRSDFKQDTKWKRYLPVCHRFYFVTPWKLIQPDEIEEPAGLYWITKTGNRAILKKHAAKREVKNYDLPMIYILMWRARIINASN